MKNNNLIFIIIFLFVCIFAVLLFYILSSTAKAPAEQAEITIGENIFYAEIADTNDERTKGLSGREYLPENTGMLFIFEEPHKAGFWMKDMKFPIDIIWIKEGKVIDFTENVKPEPEVSDEDLTVYYPPSPIDMVFELNAGTVKKKNILAGDNVFLRNMIELR